MQLLDGELGLHDLLGLAGQVPGDDGLVALHLVHDLQQLLLQANVVSLQPLVGVN